MGQERRRRGYTLIELMITVVIVGVLALLAVVGYRRWVRSAHLAEAQDMVHNIRQAEESFRSENGAYLDVSGGLGKGFSYPSPDPGAFTTAWGGKCAWCKSLDGWMGMNVTAGAPVYFGYSVVADTAVPPTARVGAKTVNGQPLDLSALGLNKQPWYFIQADANLSGDGVSYTHVYAMSGTDQVFVEGDGN